MLLSSLLAVGLVGLSDASIVCKSHAKGNPVQPYNCNFRGSISRPNPITPPNNTVTFTPPSLGDDNPRWACRNKCFMTSGCKSWSINYAASPEENACTLYASRIRAMKPGQADPNSQMVFTNKGCQLGELAGGISDPDFESGRAVGWQVTGRGDSAITSKPATWYGRPSGYVEWLRAGNLNLNESSVVTLVQTTSLCQGNAYDVSFEYYIPSAEQSNPDTTSNLGVYLFGESGTGPRDYFYLKDQTFDTWHSASLGPFQIAPGEDPYTQIQLIFGTPEHSQAVIVLDNIVFTPTVDRERRIIA